MSWKKFNSPQSSKAGFFKPKDGENRIRLVSEAAGFMSEFGKTRFVAYIIDRADGQIKPFTFGPQVAGAIGALAVSSEYGFDDLPPYDMLVNKSGSGMDTEYTVTGARVNSALTDEEYKAVKKLEDPSLLAAKLQEKAEAKKKDEVDIPVYEEEDKKNTDLPF